MVASALGDYRSAAIPERWKTMLGLVERLNDNPSSITAEHVNAVKQAGWSEEAIYDAITVSALFNFYNRWVDGTGVGDMPAAAYEASGKRLAIDGYARE